MACGKPVAAYDPINDESMHSPVVTCGDGVSDWQDALETLTNDEGPRLKLGRESRQFVEARHTWNKTVDCTLDEIRLSLDNNWSFLSGTERRGQVDSSANL